MGEIEERRVIFLADVLAQADSGNAVEPFRLVHRLAVIAQFEAHGKPAAQFARVLHLMLGYVVTHHAAAVFGREELSKAAKTATQVEHRHARCHVQLTADQVELILLRLI